MGIELRNNLSKSQRNKYSTKTNTQTYEIVNCRVTRNKYRTKNKENID